ncbi:MAG: glycosyltransferase family 4 protein [Verrucomicrobiota bacterium]
MNQKLIIYTHETYPKRGGIANYCHEFANAAASEGFSSELIGHKNTAYPEDFTRPPTYSIHRGSNRGTHNPDCIWKSRRLIQAKLLENPTAYHVFAEPGPILALGLLSKNIPANLIYLTLHGSEILKWSRQPIYRMIAERAFSRARQINTVSKPINALATAGFPRFKSKFIPVPNALPEIYRKQQMPEKPLKAGSQMCLLSVGRIDRRKGYDQVITAISKLPKNQRTSLRYTIAGAEKDKAYYDELVAQAEEAGLAFNIALNCSQQELKNHYNEADVFILTSQPRKHSIEGFGLVYLEAGSFGLPCIAYKSGGVSDAVLHEKTGLLVEEGNLAALSRTIEHFLVHPEERLRLGNANYEFSTSRSWRDVVRESLGRE